MNADRRVWWLVAAIGLVTTILHAGRLFADPITQTELRDLYAIAYGHAGIGIPEKPPRVYFASAALLQALLRCQDCAPRGIQLADAVFYRDDLSASPLDRSVLVHEFVHYVQWARSGPAKTCEEWAARETEAYRVQREVLERVNVAFSAPEIERCQQ